MRRIIIAGLNFFTRRFCNIALSPRGYSDSGNALFCRHLCTQGGAEKFVSCHLESRALLEMRGLDAAKLLQALITNDIEKIEHESQSSMYTFMLNVKGRVMYDLFIHNASTDGEKPRFLIDCDSTVTQDLLTFFTRYKIRKQVDIDDVSQDFRVTAIIPKERSHKVSEMLKIDEDVKLPSILNRDARLQSFAYRFVHRQMEIDYLQNFTTVPESVYVERRYQWGIAEGVVDLPPGNCLPLESNIIFLNGASFDKGCYLGQELTARTKYTGVIRKRLMPLLFESDPGEIESGVAMMVKGKEVGKFRNRVSLFGLGLVRLSAVRHGSVSIPRRDGSVAQAQIILPDWWPRECIEAIMEDKACQTV